MTASGIEALPSTRLYELWLEQKFFDDKVALRAGQLAADTEFLVSQYATVFVNATFGWPARHHRRRSPEWRPRLPARDPRHPPQSCANGRTVLPRRHLQRRSGRACAAL